MVESGKRSDDMPWNDVNLGLLHALDFSIDAHHLILRVFDTSMEALDEQYNKSKKTFEAQIAKAYKRDESEGLMMRQEMDWEADLHRQRMQRVGALALDWLKSSLEEALEGAKKYLDLTYPSKPPYSGKGFVKTADEYNKRFKIDFTKAPITFDRIQEVALARNAGIHRNDHTLQDYLDKIKKPVFVDDEDRFFVTKAELVAVIADCEAFVRWVVKEIENLELKPALKSTP